MHLKAAKFQENSCRFHLPTMLGVRLAAPLSPAPPSCYTAVMAIEFHCPHAAS